MHEDRGIFILLSLRERTGKDYCLRYLHVSLRTVELTEGDHPLLLLVPQFIEHHWEALKETDLSDVLLEYRVFLSTTTKVVIRNAARQVVNVVVANITRQEM